MDCFTNNLTMSRILNTQLETGIEGVFQTGNNSTATYSLSITSLNYTAASFYSPDINYLFAPTSITLGATSHTMELRIKLGLNGDVANLGWGDGNIIVKRGTSVTIPYSATVREGGLEVSIQKLYDDSMVAVTPSVGSPVTVSGTVLCTGTLVPIDLDTLAPMKAIFIGDSITKASTGISSIKDSWTWQTRNYLRKNNERVSTKVFGHSGTNSLYHVNLQRIGKYDYSNLDKIFILLGTNDAAQSVSSATFITQMSELINYFKDTMPNTKIYVLGATPTDNNTWDGFLSQYRTALDTLVNTTINDPNVFYINLGDSFDRTILANYASSDSVGLKIHLSATGNAAVSANLWTKYQAL